MKSMLQLGYDLIVFQMVKHVLTDCVLKSCNTHWSEILDGSYWPCACCLFLVIGLIFAFLQLFGKVPVSRLC